MAAACIMAVASMTRSAAAQTPDPPMHPVSVVAGVDVSHDSNLYRQPSSANVTSDTITLAYVGLRLDKQLSLQRFQVEATETMLRYANSTQLDFDAHDYRGAWLWQVGSRVSGTLSASHKESLVPFEDVLNPGVNIARNARTEENAAFTVDVWALGNWYLLLGLNERSQSSDLAVATQPDFKENSHQVGAKYAPTSGSSVSAIWRSTSGDYLNQSSTPLLGAGYQQDERELQARWIASGVSTLSGRLTWLDRTQSGAGQRDFSGVSSELVYTRAVSGKLTTNFSVKRDVAPFQDTSASYTVTDTLSIVPTWKVTDRTTARLLLALADVRFAGAAIVPVNGPQRHDSSRLLELGVDWSPARRLIVSASVLRQSRDSNRPEFVFDNTISRIAVSYQF